MVKIMNSGWRGACFTALACLLGMATARAADQPALPAPVVVAAIEAAVDAYPGQVKAVAIDREEGRVVTQIVIVTAEGAERAVRVDAESGQVAR